MPIYVKKERKPRYYSKPRFGWNPPNLLKPKPGSKAEKRQAMPRAFARKAMISYSNAKLERKTIRWYNLLHWLSALLSGEVGEPRVERPPALESDSYTVDVG
jgi:hypothetical protein